MANNIGLNISLDTKEAQQSAEGLSASLGSLGASFARMSAIIGGFTAINTVADQFQQAIQSAIDFEAQMADVQKVTDQFTAEQLSASIRQLSSDIPLAREELAKITEQAGRLGIQGTENIEQFTTTISKLSVATNITAEEAANSFARIVAVTDATINDMEELGSIVNELSNTMATSADEIVEGMLRSSAAASRFGLTAGEIASVSASINEVSATARRANTRVRRLFQELQEPSKIEDIAKAFSELNKNGLEGLIENDPSEALRRIITLFRRGGRSADQLTQALGSASRQALAGLAQNTEGLSQALENMNEQQEKANSLQREFEIQASTTQSRAQQLRNRFKNLQTAVGNEFLPALNSALQTLGKWTQELNRAISGTTKFTRELETMVGGGTVTNLQKELDRSNDSILSFDTKMVGLASTLATATVGITSFIASAGTLTPLLLTAGTAITGFASTIQKGRKETQKLNDRMKAFFKRIETESRSQGFLRRLTENISSFTEQVNSGDFENTQLEEFIKDTEAFDKQIQVELEEERIKRREGLGKNPILGKSFDQVDKEQLKEKLTPEALKEIELSDLTPEELDTLGAFLEDKVEREYDDFVKNTDITDKITSGLTPSFETALNNIGQVGQNAISNQTSELSKTLSKELSESFTTDELRNITPLKRQEIFDQVLGNLSASELRGDKAPSIVAENYIKELRNELQSKGKTVFSEEFFLSKDQVIQNQIDKIQKALESEELTLPEGIDVEQAQGKIKRLREELGKTENELSNIEKGLVSAVRNFRSTFTNALTDMVTEGKLSFQELADSLRQTFTKQLIDKAVVGPITTGIAESIKGGEGGVNTGNKIGGLFLEGASMLGLGPTSSANDALIKDDGEVVKFHPNDNIMAFRDKGPIVEGTNRNQQQQPQESTTVNQNINVATGVRQTVRAELKNMGPQIKKIALQGVQEARRRK